MYRFLAFCWRREIGKRLIWRGMKSEQRRVLFPTVVGSEMSKTGWQVSRKMFERQWRVVRQVE